MSSATQKYIDRAVGTRGTLRIPAYWMHRILSDLLSYCESKGDYADLEALRTIVETLASDVAQIQEDVTSASEAMVGLDTRIGSLEEKKIVKVTQQLPEVGDADVIYLTPTGGTGNDVFVEWVYVSGNWEKFGEFKAEIPMPDWSAGEGEAGHIKSRTHYSYQGGLLTSVMVSSLSHDPENPTVVWLIADTNGAYVAVPAGWMNKKLMYIAPAEEVDITTTMMTDPMGNSTDLHLHVSGNVITGYVSANGASADPYTLEVYSVALKPLAEGYIPDTIARKGELPKVYELDTELTESTHVLRISAEEYWGIISSDAVRVHIYKEKAGIHFYSLLNTRSVIVNDCEETIYQFTGTSLSYSNAWPEQYGLRLMQSGEEYYADFCQDMAEWCWIVDDLYGTVSQLQELVDSLQKKIEDL